MKQVSQKSLNDVTNFETYFTQINPKLGTLQKSSFTTNTTLNKISENGAFQLNLLIN